MLTEKQKKERLGYLGASDAAAVMGLSRWATPLSVWAEKTGQIVREDDDAFHLKLGHKMERIVAELFTEETGLEVEEVPDTVFHPVHEFIACNLDRRVKGDPKKIVQLKTASGWKAKEWDGDEIPTEYILQEIHELAVTGADLAYIAVAIGNQAFKIKKIHRADVLVAMENLIAREVAFWNEFVIPKKMPTIITYKDRDTLEALFPEGVPGEPIQLPETANSLAENLEALKADLKTIEMQVTKNENELLAMLGANESGTTGRWRFDWVNTGERRFKSKRFKKDHPDLYEAYRERVASRRFQITAIKEEANGDSAERR